MRQNPDAFASDSGDLADSLLCAQSIGREEREPYNLMTLRPPHAFSSLSAEEARGYLRNFLSGVFCAGK